MTNKKIAVLAVLLIAAALFVGAAAAEDVAKIGSGATFSTLQAAVGAAANEDTITLLADITYEYPTEPVFKNGTYGSGTYNAKKLVLDLNEKTISAKINASFTGSARDLIFNGMNFQIKCNTNSLSL